MIYVYKLVQIDTKKLLFCVMKICDLGQKWSHFSTYPNYKLPFILHTDSSLEGLGVVLYQI